MGECEGSLRGRTLGVSESQMKDVLDWIQSTHFDTVNLDILDNNDKNLSFII